MSDDAYITLRTVDNFINGYGLTWNVTERVEVYTHPFWMLILSFFYFFTHEAYLTTIFLSLVLTLIILIYLQSKIKPFSHFLLIFLVIGLSNAFVDFSTSGLENSLGHLLFVLFFFQFFGKQEKNNNYFKVFLLAGLIGITRLDLLIIILPILICCFIKQPDKWKAILIGLFALAPLIAWEIFSYFYYGYLFPNTFYAKLNTGIPPTKLALQGIFYFIAAIKRDPLTIFVLLFGATYSIFNKKTFFRLWGVGLSLYLAYIIKVGGDFMVGRFFTIPFLVSLLIVSQGFLQKLDLPKIIMTCALVIGLGLLAPTSTFQQLNPNGYFEEFHGIVDEREIYFWGTGLFRYGIFNNEPNLDWIEIGKALKKQANIYGTQFYKTGFIGFLGYYAGPNVYVVDYLAIGNAFLSHQPIININNWRIGHFEREVNQDYFNSIKSGFNRISNEKLSTLYDEVVLKTQTRIFDKNRLAFLLKIRH